jgi:hypothetical protein
METLFVVAGYNLESKADMRAFKIIGNYVEDADRKRVHDHLELQALSEGLNGPYMFFSGNEITNIVALVPKLGLPVPFKLPSSDGRDAADAACYLTQGVDGVNVQLSGHSDYCSNDEMGFVGLIENYDGEVYFRAYGDINSEEPTATISFDGAPCENRIIEDE